MADSLTSTPLEDLDVAAADYSATCHDACEPGRPQARDAFVTFCLPLARRLARRFRDRGEPMADLEQVARLGLLRAVDRYDPDRGSFTAYAVMTITGELKRHFRDYTWGVHVPRPEQEFTLRVRAARQDLLQRLGHEPTATEIARYLGIARQQVAEIDTAARAYEPLSLDKRGQGVDDQLLGDLIGGPDPGLQLVDERLALRDLLRRLPERERTLLALRFYGDYTQQQVAERLGISQMHVSRLQQQTLSWLRAAMLTDTPPDYPGTDCPSTSRDRPRSRRQRARRTVQPATGGETRTRHRRAPVVQTLAERPTIANTERDSVSGDVHQAA